VKGVNRISEGREGGHATPELLADIFVAVNSGHSGYIRSK
jgi:hypothetical protein